MQVGDMRVATLLKENYLPLFGMHSYEALKDHHGNVRQPFQMVELMRPGDVILIAAHITVAEWDLAGVLVRGSVGFRPDRGR